MKKIILILITIIIILSIIFAAIYLTPKDTTLIIYSTCESEQGYIVTSIEDENGEYFFADADIKITNSNGTVINEFHQDLYPMTMTPIPYGNYTVELTYKGDTFHKPSHTIQEVYVNNETYYDTIEYDSTNGERSSQNSQFEDNNQQDSSFNLYTYYDNHNWGENQRMDDYIEDNYWDEEIYDDPYTYDGEGQ